jgi:hypothetical protein
MLRKILLATSTLGVILVLFVVYHLSTGGAVQSEAVPAEAILAEKELVLPEAPASQPVQQLAQIKGVPIGAGGKKAWVTWYDKKTRKARIQFRATTWEPVSDTEFHLVDLEVRMAMPGGQIAEVQADEGRILVSPGDLSGPVPSGASRTRTAGTWLCIPTRWSGCGWTISSSIWNCPG